MFNWNVEEMELLKEFKENNGIPRKYVFKCESELPREEKIALVDERYDGKLSYILGLVDKFNAEKDGLPKDSWGNIKTISLKAWINRNDTKYGKSDYHRMIDSWYNYGRVSFIGCDRWITLNMCKSYYDTHENYVDEIFHRMLYFLKDEEEKYFKEHDEYEILKSKFRNDRNFNTTFGVHIGCCSDGNIYVYDKEDNDNRRPITIDELKLLLAMDEKLKVYEQELCNKQVNIEFQKGWDNMLHIEFEYADALSNWEWRKQSCTVSSVEECKRIYVKKNSLE